MSKQTRKVRGQLLELDSKNLIAEGDVSITLDQDASSSRPTLHAIITIVGNKPQLHYESCILRLNSNMAGQVTLLFPPVSDLQSHSFDQTTFQVIFESPNWTNDIDWFHALPEK
jgi:hypothetical protein